MVEPDSTEIEEEEDTEQNRAYYKGLKPHLYKPGQSGNPAGRPKGSKSLKDYARRRIAQMTPAEMEEFLTGLDKLDIWQMVEGRPNETKDVQITVPKPILGGLSQVNDENTTLLEAQNAPISPLELQSDTNVPIESSTIQAQIVAETVE